MQQSNRRRIVIVIALQQSRRHRHRHHHHHHHHHATIKSSLWRSHFMQRSVILCNNPPYYNLIFIAQTAMNRRHC